MCLLKVHIVEWLTCWEHNDFLHDVEVGMKSTRHFHKLSVGAGGCVVVNAEAKRQLPPTIKTRKACICMVAWVL